MNEKLISSSKQHQVLQLPFSSNQDLSRLFPLPISRRTFLTGSAAIITGAAILATARPAFSQEDTDEQLSIDDLISHTDVMLGHTNITAAATNDGVAHIHSSTYEFPKQSLSIITSDHYDERIANPGYFEISSLQSAVPPDFPVVFWGHSGIIKGQKLPFEGLRETVEGPYIFDPKLSEYVAKFVGPIQQNYKIEKALEKDRLLKLSIENQEEDLIVNGIQIIPHTQINTETMQALFQKGSLKLATCGTSASFAVRGAEYHCNRLKIHDRSITNALNTLNTPDAEGTDVYEAMVTIYKGIKSIDPAFARFLFAVYSRQIETTSSHFRNLSEKELAIEPIPGTSKTGINFFTAQQIITQLYLV